MEQIRHYFEKTIQQKLTDADWQIFSSKLLHTEFPKNYILLKTGETENYLSFVETGIIRQYIPGVENASSFCKIRDVSF